MTAMSIRLTSAASEHDVVPANVNNEFQQVGRELTAALGEANLSGHGE